MTTFLMFIAGLAILTLGAELFVRNSSALALRLGISPLVIGLTLVAMGTSAPEMAVSLKGVYTGVPDIAVGNVVGSNIFNVLFILGVSALIIPLTVHLQILRLDIPVMIAASALMWLFAFDGRISFYEGMVMVGSLVGYTFYLIWLSQKEKKQDTKEFDQEFGKVDKQSTIKIWILSPLMILSGLGLLVFGARWMVDAAVQIARGWGVSEAIIGLTIVAAGTSLPEVATSIVAAIKGERDIAVGNVVGSNVFNILGILGFCAIASGSAVPVSDGILRFDIPIMVAVAFACLPIFFTSSRISRWEGALFFFYYVAYTLYLVLQSVQHDQLPQISSVMLGFVIPITVLTLLVTVCRKPKARAEAAA